MLDVQFSSFENIGSNIISEMIFGPPISSEVSGYITYYKMVGKDSGESAIEWVSWKVVDTPDYLGTYAPSTSGPVTNIYVSSSYRVTI